MPIVLADFINRADVRMIQCRGSLGFALEAAQSLRVLCYIVGEEFESHRWWNIRCSGSWGCRTRTEDRGFRILPPMVTEQLASVVSNSFHSDWLFQPVLRRAT